MGFLPETDRYAFTLSRTVTTHDSDAAGRMKLSAVMRFAESLSTSHLEALDLGYARLYGEGIVFVLAALAIKVYAMPKMYDELTLKTCPAGKKGAQLMRESVILNGAGERQIEVQASWVMIDPAGRKPLRASAFTYPLPMIEDYAPFYDPTRMKLPSATTPVLRQPVLYSHLDINRHMNNTIYADLVMDALPLEDAVERTPDTLLLRLRHETKAGEVIDLFRDPIPGGYLVSALTGDATCFEASITFRD